MARMHFTAEAVLTLAPDDASAKAARGLATPAKWPLLGADEIAAWGECQGSGSRPYQTQVDFNGPAFSCSCPSRKFPCKHGIALLLLRAQDARLFTSVDAPAWVGEWLASRGEKAKKKEAREADGPVAAADPEASARREEQRWQRIETAAQELQRWLADQMARGLGALASEILQAWQTMGARMVDAQAPGLGARVREAAAGVRQGVDWPERTLHRLGILQLLCDALLRRRELSSAVQADLRTAVGWPLEKVDVAADGERVRDVWTVLGCVTEERDAKITERRVWLHGQQSGRRAWLLDHAFGGTGFELAWLTGSSVATTLAFFPGNAALRAMAVEPAPAPGPAHWPEPPMEAEWASVARRVAACPWTSLHPIIVSDAVALRSGDKLLAISNERALTLDVGDADGWKILAASGGRPVRLMGEWDGRSLRPLTAWVGDAATPLWQRANA